MEHHKKSYYNCSVEGCFNSTLNTDLSFFRLPPFPERRIQWLKLIHREDLTNSTCLRARVCEAHFKPSSVMASPNRKVLKRTAVPQLFLPLATDLLKFKDKETQTCIDAAKKYFRRQPKLFITVPLSPRVVMRSKDNDDDDDDDASSYSDFDDNLAKSGESFECRACLEMVDKNNLMDIFQPWSNQFGVGVTIAEDLCKLAEIEISPADPHSKFICLSCHKKLLHTRIFIINVQKSQEFLRKRPTEVDNSWPQPIDVQTNLAGTTEIKQEFTVEIDTEKQMYTQNMQMEIKVEPEEIYETTETESSVKQSSNQSFPQSSNQYIPQSRKQSINLPRSRNQTENVQSNVKISSGSIPITGIPTHYREPMPLKITVNKTYNNKETAAGPVMTIHGDEITNQVQIKEESSDSDDSSDSSSSDSSEEDDIPVKRKRNELSASSQE